MYSEKDRISEYSKKNFKKKLVFFIFNLLNRSVVVLVVVVVLVFVVGLLSISQFLPSKSS